MKPNTSSLQVSVGNALTSLVLAWVLGIQIAAGQSTAFTYQGRLNDGASPASGIYDLRFTIHDWDTGGSAIGGPLTNSPVAVSNGLFTVSLDFGADVFTGADRWLEIGVRTNGGVYDFQSLNPRQPITSTPYAIRAANFSGTVASSQLTGTISPNNIGAGSINSTMLAAGAVTTVALANGAVTGAKMFTVSNWFTLTIANPSPEDVDLFGSALSALGNDRILIGAQVAGEAYLFGVNGALLTTFTAPGLPSQSSFGSSVAAVGSDRVLIGARTQTTSGAPGAGGAGAAYLYTTNGVLLTTITNPAPASNDEFGSAVAAVGNSLVLIGAHDDDTSTTNAGIAYLYSTNGSLVATFTNPTPVVDDSFGISVAAVGSDRVLIGAHHDDTGATNAGAAYLFGTNGTLLTTFTNPLPASGDEFGFTLAAVGSDRVLIGATFGDVGGVNAGAAYLFSTSGTLLTTFTNPSPSGNDFFGVAVAAVGNDRVLIGAPAGDEGGFNVGSVYLFSTNGALLAAIANPTPAQNDKFGLALAAVGSNRVLVGNEGEDTGALNTGEAYLFTPESFTPGLVAEGVRAGVITSANIAAKAVTSGQLAAGAVGESQLADAAVTLAKLDPTIGIWTSLGADVFRSAGHVGIGTTSPQTLLEISGINSHLRLYDQGRGNSWHIYPEFHGNPAISGNLLFIPGPSGVFGFIQKSTGNYFSGSDARLKKDITDLDGVLDRVLQLRPVSYRFKSASEPAPRTLGFVAQEVEMLFPEAVAEQDGTKALSYSALVPVAVGAIQELNRKLTAELKRRDSENAELRQRLERVERLVEQNHKNNGVAK